MARVLANLGWTIAGIIVFAICIDIFGGYPRWHTEALDWIAVGVVIAAGAIVWYWHESRHGG